MPQARIIIVNHNGGAFLERCLQSVSAQTMSDFEVVVVDNASSDGSEAAVSDFDDRFELLRLGENAGFALANNKGAEGAEASLLVTLNPDAFPDRNWLSALCDASTAFPEVAMFGSVQLSDRDPSQFDGVGDAYMIAGIPWRGENGRSAHSLPKLAETFSPCAAAAVYRREAFTTVGGFDSSFFCYCEDIDLAFRLRLRGQHCFQVADARVRHVGSASTGKRSDFAIYHGARNRIWVMAKNMPLPLLIIALPLHALALVLLTLRAAFRRGGLGEIRAMWGGVATALAGLRPMLRKRREIQRSATVGWLTIARAMTWSPWRYLSRRADLRPLD